MKVKKCVGCQEDKSLDNFYRNKNGADGRQPRCKVCMRSAYNTTRNKKKVHYNKVKRERVKATGTKWRLWKEEKGCIVCNETFGPCLQLHHLDPTLKEDAVSNMVARGTSWENILNEAAKGVIVCGNCHVKIHQGYINITENNGV